jgi:hypothetical protein
MDLEQRLRETPFRRVPADWRAAILPRRASWFWPSPYAWAAVAAIWVLIAGLQLVSHPAPTDASAPAGNGAAWASRQQLLHEFTGDHS